jgi:membrane-associated phospholipid phosphatase
MKYSLSVCTTIAWMVLNLSAVIGAAPAMGQTLADIPPQASQPPSPSEYASPRPRSSRYAPPSACLSAANSATQSIAAESSSRGEVAATLADTPADAALLVPVLSHVNVSAPVDASGQPDRCDFISSFGACVRDVLHDQRGIWTSPAHIHTRDLLWLAPLAVATAVSIHYDAATLNIVDKTDGALQFSNAYTHIASPYVLVGGSAAIYAFGKFTHNERARETGVLTLEALADSLFVDEVLKVATNRERPNSASGLGRFWPDGPADKEIFTVSGSFPSGHATASWAFAHVLVDETPHHRWLHAGIYMLAAGVSVGRVTGRYHFPSDAVVGSALGYLIGGYVYREHSQFYDAPSTSLVITPISDGATRSYGLSVSFASLHDLPFLRKRTN